MAIKTLLIQLAISVLDYPLSTPPPGFHYPLPASIPYQLFAGTTFEELLITDGVIQIGL